MSPDPSKPFVMRMAVYSDPVEAKPSEKPHETHSDEPAHSLQLSKENLVIPALQKVLRDRTQKKQRGDKRSTAGTSERSVLKCIASIKEYGLDLEVCREKGGAWQVAAERLMGISSAEMSGMYDSAKSITSIKIGEQQIGVSLDIPGIKGFFNK